MAKRLTDTEKWNDDWYISLSNDYRIVWQWLLDNCNHAGICKRSIRLLNLMCNCSVSEDDVVKNMDGRLLIIDNNWFIPKFLKFQYPSLRSQKPVILSAVRELLKGDYYKMIPKSFGNDYIIKEELLNDYSKIIKSKSTSKSKSINNDNNTVKDNESVLKGGMGGKFDLTQDEIQLSIEYLFRLGIKTFSIPEIENYWKAFSLHNEFNESRGRIVKHFRDWIKKENLQNGTHKPTTSRNSKQAGAINLLNDLKSDLTDIARRKKDS